MSHKHENNKGRNESELSALIKDIGSGLIAGSRKVAKKGLEGFEIAGSTINQYKPFIDSKIDKALIFGTGNLGYALTAFNSSNLLKQATEVAAKVSSEYPRVGEVFLFANDYIHDHELLVQTAAVAAMTAGAKKFNSGLSVVYHKIKEDNDKRLANNSGGSKLGWLKSAALVACLGSLVNSSYDVVKTVGKIDKFVETTETTSGGYDLFSYSGRLEDRSMISQAFDDWDDLRGDNCANTGYSNVREENGSIVIAANCSGEKIDEVNIPFTSQTPANRDDYTKIDYDNPTIKRKLEEGKIDLAFLEDVEEMCERLDMHCMGLMSVMDYETVGSFRPDIKNPGSSATGLIQFISSTAEYLDTSTTDLADMSQREQLEYVEKYFRTMKNGFDYSDPTQIALTVFQPAARGNGGEYIIGRRGANGTKGVAFMQNSGLDQFPRDGIITAGEYTRPSLSRGYL
jgi:hypothetical protein